MNPLSDAADDSYPPVALKIGRALSLNIRTKYAVPLLLAITGLSGGAAYKATNVSAEPKELEARVKTIEEKVSTLEDLAKFLVTETREQRKEQMEQWKYLAQKSRDTERAEELDKRIKAMEKAGH